MAALALSAVATCIRLKQQRRALDLLSTQAHYAYHSKAGVSIDTLEKTLSTLETLKTTSAEYNKHRTHKAQHPLSHRAPLKASHPSSQIYHQLKLSWNSLQILSTTPYPYSLSRPPPARKQTDSRTCPHNPLPHTQNQTLLNTLFTKLYTQTNGLTLLNISHPPTKLKPSKNIHKHYQSIKHHQDITPTPQSLTPFQLDIPLTPQFYSVHTHTSFTISLTSQKHTHWQHQKTTVTTRNQNYVKIIVYITHLYLIYSQLLQNTQTSHYISSTH